ncbi:MAG: hypothetical protein N2378_00025 [Chloroflexaceae bacterium]|nr:hypothetical protein [Chloroflexaceae bacterium]
MNMALIALPSIGKKAVPPLTLAYLATLLEQRRHIVRIYDLALEPGASLAEVLPLLRSFRPQVVVVAGESADLLVAVAEVLRADASATVVSAVMSRSGLDASRVCPGVLRRILAQTRSEPGTTGAPLGLDQLPFPARHLLSLERYPLRAVGGELQTTLLIGAGGAEGEPTVFRAPLQIVAELRSVAQEFGIRHFLIPNVPITEDREWLQEWLARLAEADLGISWEAIAQPRRLDGDLVALMARAGCEALRFQIDAAQVFESTAAREQVRQAVAQARQHGIFSRGDVTLVPPYESIPYLVDVAATFGLDDVRFDVAQEEAVSAGFDEVELRELARQIYNQGRDRQRFINRFGPALGNLIWRLRGPRGPAPQQFDDEGLTA